jgi:hypothetical protein
MKQKLILFAFLLSLSACGTQPPTPSELIRNLSEPRYTDNADGTVTNNRTGLIWLKNANCFGETTWYDAKKLVAKLAHGQCGLSDGSQPGMWRLPTKNELRAMVDKKYKGPALSNAVGTGKWNENNAFLGVQSSYYWSSNTNVFYKSYAWNMYLNYGEVFQHSKTRTNYVWPVRSD